MSADPSVSASDPSQESENPVSVLVCGGDSLSRGGVRELLQRDDGISVVTESGDGLATVRQPHHATVVLAKAPDHLPSLIADMPRSRLESTVLVTGDLDLKQCICAVGLGVGGLAHREACDEISHAVHAVSSGRSFISRCHMDVVLTALRSCVPLWLSPGTAESHTTTNLTCRERDVLSLLCKGLTNREIAAALNLGVRTVKFHVSNVLAKTGAPTRGHLAASVTAGVIPVQAH